VGHFTGWLCDRPGNGGQFYLQSITRTAVDLYLSTLKSTSHKNLAVGAPGFCTWLIEEKRILEKNPTRGISMPRWLL